MQPPHGTDAYLWSFQLLIELEHGICASIMIKLEVNST